VTRAPRPAVLLGVLLVAVVAAFLPALRGGFVWDDSAYVVGNDSIRSLTPSSLARILTTAQVGNYHPLTMLSLAIDRAVFGLDPFGYHLVNLLLHLANVLLLLWATTVFLEGSRVVLSPKEYRLLQVLAQHAGNVVTHNILLREVWGARHMQNSHYLRILVRKLRRKIERDPKQPRILVSELGVGYRLTSNVDPD